MIDRSREVLHSPEAERAMTDELNLVVHPFEGTVGDPQPRPSQDAIEIANRLKGALSGLIGFLRALYLCGFQQLQQGRKRFKKRSFAPIAGGSGLSRARSAPKSNWPRKPISTPDTWTESSSWPRYPPGSSRLLSAGSVKPNFR